MKIENRLPDVTDESVKQELKRMRKEKSFWYKLRLNRGYVKLDKEYQKCADPAIKCDIGIRLMKLLNTGLISKRNIKRSKNENN